MVNTPMHESTPIAISRRDRNGIGLPLSPGWIALIRGCSWEVTQIAGMALMEKAA